MREKIDDFRLRENLLAKSLDSAARLKRFVAQSTNLQIVTAESLTAGMISKTLADIPRWGEALYGGFVVYDTDAKRQMLGVTTKGVYSETTARQMARGAVVNTRASLGIAVTGNAMAYSDDLAAQGIVYIGICVRLPDGALSIASTTMHACEDRDIASLCSHWKQGYSTGAFPSAAVTALIADVVRLKTVFRACKFTLRALKELVATHGSDFLLAQNVAMPKESYDHVCRPSGPLENHLQTGNQKQCAPKDETLLPRSRRLGRG